ncbi:MAG: tRNA/rRNA methyltransferase [Candidatus Cyclobacteriaceae bacterium M3_2C_046]
MLHFILVEPAVPENIGASARAIKTMGFTSLRLVGPAEFSQGKARWVAHGSADILDQADVFDDLSTAVADLDFVIGTTAKKRSTKLNYFKADQLGELLRQKGTAINQVGLVFGREESGLTNQELRLCHIVTSIPLAAPFPSLNLSQAVMLYAYELAKAKLDLTQRQEVAHAAEWRVMDQEVKKLLQEYKIDKNPNLYYRILERLALIGQEDVHLILSLVSRVGGSKSKKGYHGNQP